MDQQKLALIEVITQIQDKKLINALYKVLIKKDNDYIEDLFDTEEELIEFVEKYYIGG